jgi:DNA-binding beta-propeller fold protein YncE
LNFKLETGTRVDSINQFSIGRMAVFLFCYSREFSAQSGVPSGAVRHRLKRKISMSCPREDGRTMKMAGRGVVLAVGLLMVAGCAGLSDQTVTVGPPPPYAPKETVVATRAGPDAAIHLGPGVTGVVVGEGAVWVLQGGRLLKIDPKSNRVLAVIPKIPGSASFAAGAGGVWVAEGSKLLKIEPRTGRFVTRIPVACETLAVGMGSVWVSDPRKGIVSRINPQTGKVAATIGVGKGPKVLAVDAGSVWVLGWKENLLFQIDPKANQVVAKVPLGAGIPIGGLAAGEGGVWVSKQARLPLGVANALMVVDPGSKQVTKVFKIWFDGCFVLGGGAVWVTTPEYVARIDMTSGRVVEKIRLQLGGYGDMAVGEDAVWLIGEGSDTLWRINFQSSLP